MDGEQECKKCGVGCFDDGGNECHCPSCGSVYAIGKKGEVVDTGMKLMPMAVKCGHVAPECIVLKNGSEMCFRCAIKSGYSAGDFEAARITVFHKITEKLGRYRIA